MDGGLEGRGLLPVNEKKNKISRASLCCADKS